MYLSQLMIENFRQFGASDPPFALTFAPGVTALVGENDSGKTAVIDAIRYALLTRDTDYIRVQPDDFHIADGSEAIEIVIRCRLSGLSIEEKGAFAEHLTYEDGEAVLYVHWRARRLTQSPVSRRLADVSVRSGVDGSGPSFDLVARQLLSAAYLKPLRDAEREMSPGSGSRLSQVLGNFPDIKDGEKFDADKPPETLDLASKLSLGGLAEYFRHLVNQHKGVSSAQNAINTSYLSQLMLAGESLHGRITFTHGGTDRARIRQILERLQLDLLEGPAGTSRGRYGLGSNNLLYVACELLLLGKDPEGEGFPLLLIEEPEAHLHPQRQLRLMEFLGSAAGSEIPGSRAVQVILSTHSPNLASKIPLENLVLMEGQRAYSLAQNDTKLNKNDYRFLERFLDSTKANLFFARGLLIVEGDAEAIVLPALARMLKRDLTQHGVSIVNVGGTGLRRYARILQRSDPSRGEPTVPVACLADMDVMPDCAPQILGLITDANDNAWSNSRRRWRVRRDFGSDDVPQDQALAAHRSKLAAGDSGPVKTFVSDHWTFEYDLARSGLAREVFMAAMLAKNDDPLNDDRKNRSGVASDAVKTFDGLKAAYADDPDVLCSHVYRVFAAERASKAVAAQYLVEILEAKVKAKDSTFKVSADNLPKYLVEAINHVTKALTATDLDSEGDDA